jgi:hypothetical protein
MLRRNRWAAGVLLVSLVLFNRMPLRAQTATGNAETKGVCSPAISGNSNQVTIKCDGIRASDAKKMTALLNKILANEIDPGEVTSKLDELLRLTNADLALERKAQVVSDALSRFASQWQDAVRRLTGGGVPTDDEKKQELAQLHGKEQDTYRRWYQAAVKDVAISFKERFLGNDGIEACMRSPENIGLNDAVDCAAGIRLAARHLAEGTRLPLPVP